MITPLHVELAAKFYEARRLLRRVLGDQYAAQIGEVMAIIQIVAKERGKEVFQTTLDMLRECQDGPEFLPPKLLAACCELIEPDALSPPSCSS